MFRHFIRKLLILQFLLFIVLSVFAFVSLLALQAINKKNIRLCANILCLDLFIYILLPTFVENRTAHLQRRENNLQPNPC